MEQVAQLELRALRERDTELYLSLQDSADPAWREAQAAYTETAALPLPLQAITRTRTVIGSARIVGDGARVQIRHAAVLPTGESATFRAVRFYRLADSGRWVHTKVDPNYAGREVRYVGSQVEVRVLQEDAHWIEPLTPGLERLLSGYCDLTSCQLDLPLRLDLAATLDEAATASDFILPAPFLLGAPEGEVAQAAWENSLRNLLLDQLIARQISSRPQAVHKAEVFQERMRAWFHGRLGLTKPPAPDRELLWRAFDAKSWIPLWELWSLSPDDSRRRLAEAEIDLLLAFIEAEYGPAAVARLPEALVDARHPGEAIARVVRDPWWIFRRRYLSYAREVTAREADRLTGFSSCDLIVRCWETVDSTSFGAIWGLRLGETSRTLLSVGFDAGDLLPVSWAPDGLRLLTVRQEDHGLGFYLLRTGSSEPQPLPTMPEDAEPVGATVLGNNGWSPDGTHLAYRVPGRPVAGGAVDLRTGGGGRFDGDFLAWSSDSSQLLYAQPTLWRWLPDVRVRTFGIWDRESGRDRPVGQGYAATWSPDGGRVVYVSVGPALQVYDTSSGETTTLLDEVSLRQILGSGSMPSSVSGRPFELAWSPAGEWIALGVTRSEELEGEEGLTILVGSNSHRVVTRQAGGLLGLAWSPDGRRLATFTFTPNQHRVFVTDTEGEGVIAAAGSSISWSPAGQYLAIQQGAESLRVLEIESGEWQNLEVEGDCAPLIWNPRAPIRATLKESSSLEPRRQ